MVQGLFPLVFVILFLSDAFFPANLMLEPAATVAEYNPLSFIVDGIREPIIAGFDGARRAGGDRLGARHRRARADAQRRGHARARVQEGRMSLSAERRAMVAP